MHPTKSSDCLDEGQTDDISSLQGAMATSSSLVVSGMENSALGGEALVHNAGGFAGVDLFPQKVDPGDLSSQGLPIFDMSDKSYSASSDERIRIDTPRERELRLTTRMGRGPLWTLVHPIP